MGAGMRFDPERTSPLRRSAEASCQDPIWKQRLLCANLRVSRPVIPEGCWIIFPFTCRALDPFTNRCGNCPLAEIMTY
jgi:hypothetical protein